MAISEKRKRKTSFINVRFLCSEGCDSCCRRPIGVPLTKTDRKRLFSKGQADFLEENNHPLFPYRLGVNQNACCFLSPFGKCLIYDIRPLLCRTYPLQINFSLDGNILWCLEHCPGLNENRGGFIDDRYLENIELEIEGIEGKSFFDGMKNYVLKNHNQISPFTRILQNTYFIEPDTKNRIRNIISKVLSVPEFEALSIKGRFECMYHDLLPIYKKIFFGKIIRDHDTRCHANLAVMEDAWKIFYEILPELAKESSVREKIHLEKLEKEGRIVGARPEEKKDSPKGPSLICVTGYDGRKIEIHSRRLMKMLPIHSMAMKREKGFFKELLKREGLYGKSNVDVPLDCELYFLFLAADSIELKANAFAIEKGKDEISEAEIKEAIWIIERSLGGLLERAMAFHWGKTK